MQHLIYTNDYMEEIERINCLLVRKFMFEEAPTFDCGWLIPSTHEIT
jgi:hypothetical protein